MQVYVVVKWRAQRWHFSVESVHLDTNDAEDWAADRRALEEDDWRWAVKGPYEVLGDDAEASRVPYGNLWGLCDKCGYVVPMAGVRVADRKRP
jgi:hypothetical protein